MHRIFHHSLQGNGTEPRYAYGYTHDRPERMTHSYSTIHLHAVNVTHTCITIIHDIRAKGMVPSRSHTRNPLLARLIFWTCIRMNGLWEQPERTNDLTICQKNAAAAATASDNNRKKTLNQKSSITNFMFQFMRHSNQLFHCTFRARADKKVQSNEPNVCTSDNKNVL